VRYLFLALVALCAIGPPDYGTDANVGDVATHETVEVAAPLIEPCSPDLAWLFVREVYIEEVPSATDLEPLHEAEARERLRRLDVPGVERWLLGTQAGDVLHRA